MEISRSALPLLAMGMALAAPVDSEASSLGSVDGEDADGENQDCPDETILSISVSSSSIVMLFVKAISSKGSLRSIL